MERYGLLGKHLPHSMSPFIHERLFELSGRDAVYKLYECDSAEDFVSQQRLDGYNVTIPYKEDVFNLVSDIHESALPYGAVNCVDRQGVGYNTDVDGFRRSILEILPSFDSSCLLVGIGGVGKMIAKQFDPARLTVAIRNVTQKRVDNIVSFVGNGVTVVDINEIPSREYGVIVNATPIGMYPNVDSCPVGDRVIELSGAVYDTVYNPLTTRLVERARAMGKLAKCGLDMLVYQAAVAHTYWYGAEHKESDLQDIIGKLHRYMAGKA